MKTSPSRRRRSGFTLIEVMLVLVILVILAGMAVTAIGPMRRRAQIRAAKSQIGLVATALDNFDLLTGNYPATDQGLDALIDPPANLPNADPLDWPMLKKRVGVDPWENPYQYESPGKNNPSSYDIWSFGPDKINGTDDDIGNWIQE